MGEGTHRRRRRVSRNAVCQGIPHSGDERRHVERDADIALFAARPRVLKPDSIVDTDMRVSVYGEAALVTGVENLKGSYKDRYREMSLRFTNVFVHRDGRWQLVAHQSTRMRRT